MDSDGRPIMIGGEGADTLRGSDDSAVMLAGRGGRDRIEGGSGNDWLSGGAGADVLDGGAGHDVVFLDAQDVASGSVQGGAGFDIAVVSTTDGVALDAGASGFEAVFGHDGADALSAGSAGQGVLLDGRGGGDTLTGGAGNDVLAGGEGADRIDGGAGHDVLIVDDLDTYGGGDGVDTVYLTSTADVTLNVSDREVEIFHSGSGNDRLSTAQNRVTALYGGAGNDVLSGGSGGDFLAGGSGTDRLEGGYGSDLYHFGLGDGHDTINDRYIHQEMRTRTETYSYWDTVRYWYQGGEGHYDGWRTRRVRRTGTRTVEYQVDVELDAGDADTVHFGAGITVADLLLRRSGSALEIGLRDPARPDAAFGTLADRITIESWENAKRRVERLQFADGTTLSLAALTREYGLPTADLGLLDLGRGMAALVPGAEAGEVLAGTSEAERLGGTSEDETLLGRDGDDALHGGAGNDSLRGGLGDDFYYFGIGDGRDRVLDEGTVQEARTREESYTYQAQERYTYWTTERYWRGGEYSGWGTRTVRRTGTRTVTRTGTHTVGYQVEVDTDAGDDSLLLGEGVLPEHVMLRLVGNDLEIALKDPSAPGAGFDALPDRIVLADWQDAFNRIETLGFAGGTRLSLAAVVEKFGLRRDGPVVDLGAAMTTLAGTGVSGRIQHGTDAADVLVGGVAADALWGSGGDDTLRGGAGNDTLHGGAGNDVFQFAEGDGADRIAAGGFDAASTDTLEFIGALAREQLWFTRVGDDLRIDLLGVADSVTLEDWYDAGTTPAGRMDRIEADGMVLTEANVQRLVAAMATWSAGNGGQDGDDLMSMPDDRSLADALAAAWQPSSG